MKETEVTVGDFDKTNMILEAAGLKASKYQENRRTLFSGDKGVEISSDEWPMIPPYLEIEAKDEATVKDYIHKLDLGNQTATSAPPSEVYARYSKDLESYEKLVF